MYAKLLARDLPVYLCELFVLGEKRLLRRNFFSRKRKVGNEEQNVYLFSSMSPGTGSDRTL